MNNCAFGEKLVMSFNCLWFPSMLSSFSFRVPFLALQKSTNTKGNERNQLKTLLFTPFSCVECNCLQNAISTTQCFFHSKITHMCFSSTQSVGKQQLNCSHWSVILSLPTVFEKSASLPTNIPKSKARRMFLQIIVVEPCCTPTLWVILSLLARLKKLSVFSLSLFSITPIQLRMPSFWAFYVYFPAQARWYCPKRPKIKSEERFIVSRSDDKSVLQNTV